MSVLLPDPSDALTGAPRAFYDELRRMLAAVRPSRVDAEAVTVEFRDDEVEVRMVHADRADWMIEASVGQREAIVGAGCAHEHFFAPKPGMTEERPWTTQIVDFLAEMLCGEIEIQTTYRGTAPISVQHFNHDESGQRQSLGSTAFLTPGRLLIWRPKRIETASVSFR